MKKRNKKRSGTWREECGAVWKGEQEGKRTGWRRVPSAAAGQTFTRGFRSEEVVRSPALLSHPAGPPSGRRGESWTSFREPRLSDEKAVASSRVTRKLVLRIIWRSSARLARLMGASARTDGSSTTWFCGARHSRQVLGIAVRCKAIPGPVHSGCS